MLRPFFMGIMNQIKYIHKVKVQEAQVLTILTIIIQADYITLAVQKL